MAAFTDLQVLHKALYGQILSATARRTGERVVLKKLLRECVEQKLVVDDLHVRGIRRPQPMLEDARREAQVLTRLNENGGHRSVVRLLESFETDTDFVMVMENLHGDLFDLVMGSGRLHESKAQKLFLDAVGGLHFLHRHSIAHRDISLENLLLGSDERVVITDFGLCCDCAQGEMQVDKVGKGFYIAPEIFAEAGPYDPKKADIWSLGVVLFIMMTGNPPMERPSDKDKRFGMIKQGKIAEMLRQWEMDTFFSEDCLDLLSKMLVVDPAQRIDLERLMNHPWVKLGLPQRSPCGVDEKLDGRNSSAAAGPELDDVVKRLAVFDTTLDTTATAAARCA